MTTTLDAVRRVKARREQQSLDAESRVDAPGTAVMSGGMVGAVSSPSQAAHGSQILEQVLRALDRLPANRRRAVGLHLQGMSSTEVGAILGWSEAKARNLIYRGLDDLRRHLRAAGITSPDDASLGD